MLSLVIIPAVQLTLLICLGSECPHLFTLYLFSKWSFIYGVFFFGFFLVEECSFGCYNVMSDKGQRLALIETL